MEEIKHEPFAVWAILELMGHRRLAGFVQEVEIAGQGLLRIDIPSVPPVTQFYGVASIYCLTPTTEAIARALASRVNCEPVHQWELPAAPQQCPHCGEQVVAGQAAQVRSDGLLCHQRCIEAVDDKAFEKGVEEAQDQGHDLAEDEE